MIMTYNGLKRIDEVKPNEYVLSYCEAGNRAVYRKVVAVAQRQAFDTYQVRDRLGNMVEATGNHRIYYEGSWAPAKAIAVGGSVLSYLPHHFSKGAVRASEEVCKESKLQSGVLPQLCNTSEESAGRKEVCLCVQQLRQGDVGQPAEKPRLFGRVQKGDSQEARPKNQNSSREKLRHLWGRLQTSYQCLREQVLLNEVQKRPSCNGDEGGKQSWLERWHFLWSSKKQSAERLSSCQAPRPDDGCGYVCSVQLAGQSSRPSHQPQSSGQQVCEPGDSVPVMSLSSSCHGKEQPKASAVSLVEQVRHDEGVTVYDIEVEGTHNFFANGILVHNCVIIDDPHDEQTAALAT
jgi:hypothetical protein